MREGGDPCRVSNSGKPGIGVGLERIDVHHQQRQRAAHALGAAQLAVEGDVEVGFNCPQLRLPRQQERRAERGDA